MLIYKISNDINSKIYIGQTVLSLRERIYCYKKECRANPNSRPIIRAMNKYGFEHFFFEVIHEGIRTKEELDKLERYYIANFHSLCSENGYNIELGGNSAGKHSEETKRKISEAQKGEKNHMYGIIGYDNPTSKEVIELTTGKKYGSASVAGKELGINFSHICAVARGERGSHKGYVFRYVDKSGVLIQPDRCAKIKSKSVKDKILPMYKYLFSEA